MIVKISRVKIIRDLHTLSLSTSHSYEDARVLPALQTRPNNYLFGRPVDFLPLTSGSVNVHLAVYRRTKEKENTAAIKVQRLLPPLHQTTGSENGFANACIDQLGVVEKKGVTALGQRVLVQYRRVGAKVCI